MALWDLIGKAMGQPLYKIWGGATAGYQTQPGLNRVMPYASQWTVGTPEDRFHEVQLIKAEGWKAMKLKLGLETVHQDVALMEAARKAAGDEFKLMCDGNKAGPYGPSAWPRYPWTFPRAVETARGLAPLNLTWLEEPLPRFDYDQLAQLNKMGLVPIAGGENDLGVNSFLTMLQKGSFAYLQPEVLAIGPTMLRTVGTLAAAYDVQIAPHGGSGGVCWIGIMHLIASMPNAPMMELIHEPPHGPYSAFMDIFTAPPLMKDGYITVPDGPGLGVTIRPDLIIQS
jgi:L-alanine-DL-glutamate epimerase-like enolase superfamily enzyme